MSETAAKKQVQKLQRAIVDGLQDVKAVDVRVFNTEHLSPLFERVIVASGSSNRQTKALASSVRDRVREEGFSKPRIEGEDNGEWIIVDCGAVVTHIMQPAIRQYYNLEEIWGEKLVRLRSTAPADRKGANGRQKAGCAAGLALKNGTVASQPASKRKAGAASEQTLLCQASAKKTSIGRSVSAKSGAGKSSPTRAASRSTAVGKLVSVKPGIKKGAPVKRAASSGVVAAKKKIIRAR